MGLQKRLSSVVGRSAGRSERKSILARVKGKIARSSHAATKDAADGVAPKLEPVPSEDTTLPCEHAPTPVGEESEVKSIDDDARYEHSDEITEDDGEDWDLALNPYPSDETMKVPMDVKAPILNELMSETSIEVLMRCHSPSIAERSSGHGITPLVDGIRSVGPEEAAAIATPPPPCTRTSTQVSIDTCTYAHLDDKYESIEEVSSSVLPIDDWDPNTDISHSAKEKEPKEETPDVKAEEDATSDLMSESKMYQNRTIYSEMGDDESTDVSALSSIFSGLSVDTTEANGPKPLKYASDADERWDDTTLTLACVDESKCPAFATCLDKMIPSIDEEEQDGMTALTSFSGSGGDSSSDGSPGMTGGGLQRQSTPLITNKRRGR